MNNDTKKRMKSTTNMETRFDWGNYPRIVNFLVAVTQSSAHNINGMFVFGFPVPIKSKYQNEFWTFSKFQC